MSVNSNKHRRTLNGNADRWPEAKSEIRISKYSPRNTRDRFIG